MVDKLSRERRSLNMAQIGSKDTESEMQARRFAHSLGYRYRLHVKDLPGKHDLVFAGRRKVIFVHGCFWHQHNECPEGRIPGSRKDYWAPKLIRNIERDRDSMAALKCLGWKTLVLWECQLTNLKTLEKRLREFLR